LLFSIAGANIRVFFELTKPFLENISINL